MRFHSEKSHNKKQFNLLILLIGSISARLVRQTLIIKEKCTSLY